MSEQIQTTVGTFERRQILICLHNLGEVLPEDATEQQITAAISRQIFGVMEGGEISEEEAIKVFKAEYRFVKDLVPKKGPK